MPDRPPAACGRLCCHPRVSVWDGAPPLGRAPSNPPPRGTRDPNTRLAPGTAPASQCATCSRGSLAVSCTRGSPARSTARATGTVRRTPWRRDRPLLEAMPIGAGAGTVRRTPWRRDRPFLEAMPIGAGAALVRTGSASDPRCRGGSRSSALSHRGTRAGCPLVNISPPLSPISLSLSTRDGLGRETCCVPSQFSTRPIGPKRNLPRSARHKAPPPPPTDLSRSSAGSRVSGEAGR